MDNSLPTINILGVEIHNLSEEKVLEIITTRLNSGRKPFYVATPNPEMLVYASKHPEFKKILNEADLRLVDGVGLLLGARIMGKRFKGRVTGVDTLENVCKAIAKQPVSIGFLGGSEGVAERAAECLQKKHSSLKISYAFSEWDKARLPKERIDMLFVALGVPKQEKFISDHIKDGQFLGAMGVGGALDYISGEVGRAPKVFQRLGLEWFYRLVRQPWRWRRQLALIEFLYLIFKQKVFSKSF